MYENPDLDVQFQNITGLALGPDIAGRGKATITLLRPNPNEDGVNRQIVFTDDDEHTLISIDIEREVT